MKLFFIILIMLIFIPIPVKFTFYYDYSNYYIKIYRFKIFSKKNNFFKRIKKEHHIKKEKSSFIKNKEIDYRHLIHSLYHSRFKPSLKLNFKFEYCLSDCSKTAISYGMMNNLKTLIFILLNVPFKINKFNLNINPIFKDKAFFKIESLSIICISLANIIFMLIRILRNIHTIKEVNPNT